jgi:hypothetical protein
MSTVAIGCGVEVMVDRDASTAPGSPLRDVFNMADYTGHAFRAANDSYPILISCYARDTNDTTLEEQSNGKIDYIHFQDRDEDAVFSYVRQDLTTKDTTLFN